MKSKFGSHGYQWKPVNPQKYLDPDSSPVIHLYIKYVGYASVYQGTKSASAVILDKLDFNFNGEY